MESQNKMLKTILDQGNQISALDALHMIGTMRLAAKKTVNVVPTILNHARNGNYE